RSEGDPCSAQRKGGNPKRAINALSRYPPPLVPFLRKLPRRSNWVVTSAKSSRYPQSGHQISERRLLQPLKRVLKKINLPGHVHTFRHSFISNALIQGIPEATLRTWVGQVDGETMKIYTHIASSLAQEAMQQLADANARTKSANRGELQGI